VEPGHEEARLRTLRAYRVLDTEPEAAYDTLARLAASVCETPIALVALIDESRQWFKANVGLDGIVQTPRAWALSGPTTRGHEVFEVRDARADARFAGNPLVVGGPRIRFYASAPLVAPDGAGLGTLCAIDREPRELRAAQREQLSLLAAVVVEELERRKRTLGLLHVAMLAQAVLTSTRPAPAVHAALGAIGAACGGNVTLLRRAADGTYGAVKMLDSRIVGGGRAPLSGEPFRLENAPPDEILVPVRGGDGQPDFALSIRHGARRPDASDQAAFELVASALAVAARNVALRAENARRRVDLLDDRATQAELVARLARDVRGPVTSIVGFARLLEDDERFPADAREALAVVRASGERVGEIASDVELLSRIELAAVEPQWQTVDVAALATAAGAVLDTRAAARIVADPDLLSTALRRLVEDGSRAASPVHARIEDLGEAVVIELTGSGASPAGDPAAPTIAGRLTARIVERHGGSLRTGRASAAWWIRLTLPSEPHPAQRPLRVLLAGAGHAGDDLGTALQALGFAVETESGADRIRIALGSASADVVVVPVALAAFTGIDRLPADVRGRVGLVALGLAGERSAHGWDATVELPLRPAELRTAIYAAAANARLRRGRNPAGSGM
jgi:signal transduction histidine kinase